MKYLRTNACAICGEEQPGHETRFLVAENRWEDKLIILPWNDRWPRARVFRLPVASTTWRS
jgi:hypothetical protein